MIELDFYHFAIPLVVGFLLDAALGDPLFIPHPVIFFGKTISTFEEKLNHGSNKGMKGAIMAICLILLVYFVFFILTRLSLTNDHVYYAFASFFVFLGVANHGLIKESLKVHYALERQGLEAGRKQLSFIVGRDTSQLSKQQIRKAVLETLAENLSDGVIAPLFYYALGGVPFMFAYKMVNTMDSMIGYKDDRYREFGRFAAKIDDVANFIPARITALLMVFVSFSWRGLRYIFIYGNKHSSPNAGYPEAALAGILNCRFGGPNIYHGALVQKPFIGKNDKEFQLQDMLRSCVLNATVSTIFVILLLGLHFAFS